MRLPRLSDRPRAGMLRSQVRPDRLQKARQWPYSNGMPSANQCSARHRPLASRVGIAACLHLAAGCGAAGDAEPMESGPAVIRTVPSDGEVDVDANLGELRVTFSESMHRAGWSWVTEAGRSAPSVTGIPFYEDELTNVLPVRLQPHTSYVIWVNSPDDAELRKFASEDGISAP
ncbi:MAG TPA: Ig-like domain-containing protein, partial [Polyangiaceae bacterium]|nr:Ig-like domain-containing protein [Polyangiaceae bacterium]